MKKIDLHIHSHYSDGENSPEEIAVMIMEAGIDLFSIVDHNYVHAGITQLVGVKNLPKFLSGVEISSVDRITGQSLHILGYSSRFDIPKLNDLLLPIVNGYNDRAKNIITKLNERFDCNLDFEEIKKEIPSIYISRNLLATKLRGFKNDMTMEEAIKNCFSSEDNFWMPDAKNAIEFINDCGGVAVLAHPGNLINKTNVTELVNRLSDSGLWGLEVFYSRHDENTVKTLFDIAKKSGLSTTGGSDWHGKNFYRSDLGVEVPDVVYNSCCSLVKI